MLAAILLKGSEPPEEFKTFDLNIQTEHTCPKCGYEWSGSAAAAKKKKDKGGDKEAADA